MDHALHRHRHRILEAFQSRLSKLPRFAPKVRLPLWGYLLPVALLLGAWAHHGSSEEGRIGWLKSNPPSDEAWAAILGRKGFRAVEDPDWKEKAYAEMPEASRKKDQALLSEDLRTMAIRSGNEWRFFQLGGTQSGKPYGEVVKRELWMGLGLGWEAVSVFDQTEFPKIENPALPKAQKAATWSDPRSLQF